MSDLGNKAIMAENIQRLMDSRGIDRNKICADLGLKYTTFTDWVKWNTYPRIDKIELLANYFGVPKSDTLIPQGYTSKYLEKPIKRFCKEVGISDHLPHDTRHTFVTLASNYGMDRYVLKAIVGHTQSKDITADVYTHKTIEQYIEEVNKIPSSFS